MKEKNLFESFAKTVFLICALMSVCSLFIIIFYIFIKGVPAIVEIGPLNFLLGSNWSPRSGEYGIFNMIAATFVTTFIAFLIGSQIGKWCAVFLAMYCPRQIYRPVKSIVELLGGIPSVIYGFFGVMVIVPFIRNHFGGAGKSMLAAIVILSVMILPTIINLIEAAVRAVPESYYEGALALGCTKNEAVFNVVVPAARSGINAAYILGIGRAIGETMAVMLVAGNNPILPTNLLKPVRTLTIGIGMEMNYATGMHQNALFGIGVVLFTIIILLNIVLSAVNSKGGK